MPPAKPRFACAASRADSVSSSASRCAGDILEVSMRGFDSSVGIRFSLQSRLFAWANAPPPALPRNSKSQHEFGNIGHACALSKQSPCHGAAVAGRKRTPFRGVDGADALQESASNDHSLVATMID